MSPQQAARTREISETASANADRLSSPEALEAAQRRGEEKRAAAARADEQAMRTVAGFMKEGSEARAKAAFDALAPAQQLVVLEQQRAAFQKEYENTARSAQQRAGAFRDLARSETDIAEKKKQIERDATAEKEKQKRLEKQLAEETKRRTKTLAEATTAESKAQKNLATQKRDAVSFTVADAASGVRGNTFDREAARRIVRDEETARRLHDSRRNVTLFDSKTQRNFEAGSEFFQQRALTARQGLAGATSDERDPFRGAGEALKSAGADLKAAAAELKNVQLDVVVD
jgi:hypothetical protein